MHFLPPSRHRVNEWTFFWDKYHLSFFLRTASLLSNWLDFASYGNLVAPVFYDCLIGSGESPYVIIPSKVYHRCFLPYNGNQLAKFWVSSWSIHSSKSSISLISLLFLLYISEIFLNFLFEEHSLVKFDGCARINAPFLFFNVAPYEFTKTSLVGSCA